MSERCDKIVRLLADYQVGALDSQTRAQVEDHLASCTSCVDELQALKRTAQLLNATGLEPAPDSWNTVRAQLEPRPARTSRGFLPWLAGHKLQSAAAGIATLVAITALFFSGGGPAEHDAAVQTYYANHAAMSWSDPFADKAALGLAGNVQLENETETAR